MVKAVAAVTEISKAVMLAKYGPFQRAGIDGRKPGMNVTSGKRVFLAASSSPHTRMSRSGVRDRTCSAWPTGCERGQYRRAGRRQLANLLCGGSLPDAQHPGPLASYGGGQGNGGVHQNGILREPRMLFKMAACAGNGTAITRTEACAAGGDVSHPLTSTVCVAAIRPRSPFPSAVRLRPGPSSHRGSR